MFSTSHLVLSLSSTPSGRGIMLRAPVPSLLCEQGGRERERERDYVSDRLWEYARSCKMTGEDIKLGINEGLTLKSRIFSVHEALGMEL
jgi:hypothetical protein